MWYILLTVDYFLALSYLCGVHLFISVSFVVYTNVHRFQQVKEKGRIELVSIVNKSKIAFVTKILGLLEMYYISHDTGCISINQFIF